MRSLARLRMLAAFAVALGHAPKEVEDLMAAPRVPEAPPTTPGEV